MKKSHFSLFLDHGIMSVSKQKEMEYEREK